MRWYPLGLAALILLSMPLYSCSFADDVATRVSAPVKRVFARPRGAERPTPAAEPEQADSEPAPRPERVVSASDRKAIDNALSRAMSRARPGETVAWRGTTSGNSGTVAPTSRPYRDERGRTCRDFQSTVHFRDGPTATSVGARCRVRGRWVDSN